jgi:hypothetical protein
MTFINDAVTTEDDRFTQALRTHCITQSEGQVFNVMKIGTQYTTADIRNFFQTEREDHFPHIMVFHHVLLYSNGQHKTIESVLLSGKIYRQPFEKEGRQFILKFIMKAVKSIKTIPTFSIDIRKNEYNFFGCHSDLWGIAFWIESEGIVKYEKMFEYKPMLEQLKQKCLQFATRKRFER